LYKVHKDDSVDRPMSKHLKIQRKLNSHTLFPACETQIIFIGLHLLLPTSQKLLNLIKEQETYGGVWCKRIQFLMMGEFLKIKILSLKSLIIASLPLEYREFL